MNEYYSIKDLGKYRVFLPPSNRTVEKSAQSHAARETINQAYIDSVVQGNLHATMPITGSFIYAHPPNYCGAETVNWSKREWLDNLTRLKTLGIDTVIFQASLWSELEECYYPSKRFAKYRFFNILEPMLEAVRELKLTLYLGGYGSVTCWQEKIDSGIIEREAEAQLACYQELLQYRDCFCGFYFAPESSFIGKRNLELEALQSDLYGRIFKEIRAADPALKTLMSPATFYFKEPGVMQEMVGAWCSIFSQAHPDIIAPQDSIGCGCITLDHQIEGLSCWAEICKKCNIRFWSNVEVFDVCSPYIDEHSRCAAPAERVACQINHAAKFVEKLITWEALWYLSDDHPKGRPLRRFFPQFFNQELN